MKQSMSQKEINKHFQDGLDSIHLPKTKIQSGKAKQIYSNEVLKHLNRLIAKYWIN